MIRLALAVAGLAALAPVALAQPASSVITANKAALREPAKSRFVNAVQVYPYNEGALFRLFAAPERVSDIALQPGETLTSDRKSTRLNSSHSCESRMPSSA